jgi:hypothetical protein
MSNARAVKLGAAGLVLVGGAMWFSPPQPLVDWLSPDVPVVTKEPAEVDGAGEAPVEVATAINPLSGTSPDQFKETLDRPLFNPGRAGRPKDPEPEPEPEPQVTEEEPPKDPGIQAADLSLLAIAGGQDDLVAMVRWTKTNQVYRLKRGQFLSSLELVKVDLQGATLQEPGKVIELALFAKGKGIAGGGATPVSDDEKDSGEEEDSSDEEAEASSSDDDEELIEDDSEDADDEEDSEEDSEDAEDEEDAEEDSEDDTEEDSDEEFENEADEEE